MADSKRLRTLKALSAHLMAEIKVVNGYKHDLKAVHRGRLFIDDEDPLPVLSILENLDPDRFPRRAGGDDYEYGLQKDGWILLLQGWVDDDKANPTDPAYELMADTKKALALLSQDEHPVSGAPAHPSYNLGGLITGMTMEPGTVRPPMEQVSNKAFFWLRIVLQFVENPTDPYQL